MTNCLSNTAPDFYFLIFNLYFLHLHLLKDIKEALLHLAFPHICQGCGDDALDKEHMLCIRCLSSLPGTEFHFYPTNPVEKSFWGRLPVSNATAQYYFTKESLMQHIMHQIKYRGNKELALYMGRLMGHALAATNRFSVIDALIPLPLFPSKEKKRGYNQARVLADGIGEVLQKPVLNEIVIRTKHTETQTKKNRVERWQNMEKRFQLLDETTIKGMHLLLVDDVVTTGATLEACGRELLAAEDVRLSIATLCYSGH